MRARWRLLLTLTLLIAVGSVGTAWAANSQELLNLESQYMCISCHEPLDQVNSPQAISEKQQLARFMNRGLSEPEIKNAMVAQYGVAVLAKPPAHGLNLTVYILPPAVLVVGLGLLAYMLPKWRRRSKVAAQTPLKGADALEPDDAHRLDDELAKFI